MTLLDFQLVLGRRNIRPPHFASKVSYSASPQASTKCPEAWQKEGCEGDYLNLFSYLCVLQAYLHLS